MPGDSIDLERIKADLFDGPPRGRATGNALWADATALVEEVETLRARLAELEEAASAVVHRDASIAALRAECEINPGAENVYGGLVAGLDALRCILTGEGEGLCE